MPRTVPTVDGTGNFRQVTIKTIDANNGKRSDTFMVDAAATDAEIEALIAAQAAVSNANIYQVKVSMVYNSVPNPGDATEAPLLSVWDNIVLLMKDSANNSQDWFIPAPIDAALVAGTKNPNPANALLQAYRDAVDAVMASAYEPVSYRFTERSKKNPSQPA